MHPTPTDIADRRRTAMRGGRATAEAAVMPPAIADQPREPAPSAGPERGGSTGWGRLVLRGLVFLAAAALLPMLVLAPRMLERYVLARPEYQIGADALVVNRPDFLPEPLFARIVRDSHDLPERFSAADADVLRRLYESFAANPWVKRAGGPGADGRPELAIKQRWPNEVVVDMVWRRPVAVVRRGDVYVWIDAEGVVLAEGWEDGRFPPEYGGIDKGPKGRPGRWRPLVSDEAGIRTVMLQKAGQDNWQATAPIIDGVREPPPAPGRQWRDLGLRAALSLILWLNTPDALTETKGLLRRELRTVHVRRELLRTFERYNLTLATPAGSLIEWGRAPDVEDEGHIDPPAERKLERMRQVQRELGGLDGRFKTLSLRAIRKPDGTHGIRWVFLPPEGVRPAGSAATDSPAGPGTAATTAPGGRPGTTAGDGTGRTPRNADPAPATPPAPRTESRRPGAVSLRTSPPPAPKSQTKGQQNPRPRPVVVRPSGPSTKSATTTKGTSKSAR